MNGLLSAVLPSVLNKFRIYLTLLRFLDYNISDDITKVSSSHARNPVMLRGSHSVLQSLQSLVRQVSAG